MWKPSFGYVQEYHYTQATPQKWNICSFFNIIHCVCVWIYSSLYCYLYNF